MKQLFSYSFILLLLLWVQGLWAANPPVELSGVINHYSAVTGINNVEKQLTVSSVLGFEVGKYAVLVQMKDGSSGQGLAGSYEFVKISGITGNTLSFEQPLLRKYDAAGKVQLVTVPQYEEAIVIGELTAPAWNGNTGGILVLDVRGTLTLEADINLKGKGMRTGCDKQKIYSKPIEWFNRLKYSAINESLNNIKPVITSPDRLFAVCDNNTSAFQVGDGGIVLLRANKIVAQNHSIDITGISGAGTGVTALLCYEYSSQLNIKAQATNFVNGQAPLWLSNLNGNVHLDGIAANPPVAVNKNLSDNLLPMTTCNIGIGCTGSASKEGNIWYFGNGAGLDFNSGSPVPLGGGQVFTSEGCASISDVNGNLLFYTDGITVWARNHTIMPNGTGLLGNPSSTQSGIIVPNPANPNIYYVFAASEYSSGLQPLTWSEVDMTLNGGFGAVTANKNVQLSPGVGVTESLTAVRHGNGCDYWVLTHRCCGSTEMYAYLVTGTGINPVPVISTGGPAAFNNELGYFKVSPNGTRAGLPFYTNGEVAFFTFNNNTGVLNHIVTRSGFGNSQCYGLEFSANSQFVYANGQSTSLYQWDVSSGVAATILASEVFIGNTNSYPGMQLGPDCRIYLAGSGSGSTLSVINNPNNAGLACNYVINSVPITGSVQFGLPALITSFFSPLSVTISPTSGTITCGGNQLLTATPSSGVCGGSIISYQWQLNGVDIAGATSQTYTATAPGNYTVNITRASDGCQVGSNTAILTGGGGSPSSAFTLPPSICSGGSANFSISPVGGVTYSWTFSGGSPGSATGSGPHNISFGSSGSFPITVTANLAGCTSQTTLNYTVNPGLTLTPPAPLSTCVGSTVSFSVSPIQAGYTYQWSGPGFNPPSGPTPSFPNIQLANSGTYTITATDGTCTSSATTTITVVALPSSNFVVPSPICDGVNVTFNAPGGNPAGTTYLWTFAGGSPGSSTATNPSVSWTGFSSASVNLLSTGPGPTFCQSTTTQNVTINAVPSAAFSISNPRCENVGITFTSTGVNPGGTTYSWSFPTGSPVSANTVGPHIVTYGSPGNKNITLTVNNGGCTASLVQPITVNPTPIPGTPFSNSPVCEFGTLTLTAEGTPRAGATYSWTGPGGYSGLGHTVSRTNVQDNANFEGVYTVIVTENGCTSGPATVSVVINPFPNPVASNNGPVCSGGSLQLTTSPAVWTAGTSFLWSGPNAFNNPTQNPVRNPVNAGDAGTYSVTVTVPGCSPVTVTTNVVVSPAPTLNAFNSGPLCAGGTLSLSASNIAGATYSWSGPGAFSSGLQNPTIGGATTSASGVYTVTATLLGCAPVTATTTAVVNGIPLAPSVTSNSPVCVGGTLQLTANGGAGATYVWSGPGGYSFGPSVSVNASRSNAQVVHSGVYSVTQTINGCTSPVGTVDVVVNVAPSPTASNTGPACVGENDVVTFSTPLVAGGSYSWSGPNGFSSVLQNPTRVISGVIDGGTYTVSVSVPGCPSANASTVLVVNSLSAPSPTNGGPYCAGSTIQLNSVGGVGTVYSWSGPLGFSNSSQNPSIVNATTNMSGVYTVTVSIAGCDPLSGTTSVVVNNSPVPNPSNNGPLCTGEGDLLQLSSATIAGATYSWSGPGGFSSVLQNPTRTISSIGDGGSYIVTVTIPGCGPVSSTTNVVVNSILAPSPVNSGPHCVGQTLQLTAVGNGSTSYSWSGPLGYSSTGQSPVRSGLTTAMSGVYSVTVSVAGCNDLQGTTSVVVNAPPPSQTFSIGPLCSGGNLSLSAASAPVGVTWSYSWSGPNGFSSTLQNPTKSNISLADVGVYSVQISVSGCSPVLSTTTVSVNAPPSLSASNNGPLCPGGTLDLSSSTVVGATYSWSGPLGFSSGVQNPTVTNVGTDQAGVYTVTATIPGCTPATAQTTVVVNATPSAPSVGNNGPLCAGSNLALNGPFVAGASYSWSGPNGFSSTLQSPGRSNIQLSDAGAYVLVVTVNGCPSLAGSTNVVVNPIPAAPVLTNNSPLCTGGTLQLTANFVPGGSYVWSGPGGFSSNAQNPVRSSVVVGDGGVYQATVSVNGCVSLAGSTTVVVNAVPAAPLAGNNGPLCSGSTLQLTSETIAGALYSWVGPNGFVSNAQNPNIASATTNAGGVYSVVATVNGCPSLAGSTTVVVFSVPGAPAAANNGPICSGQTLELYAPQVLGGTYSWLGPNGFMSSAQNPVVPNATTLQSGTYQVTVSVNGCVSPAGSTTVQVTNIPSAPMIGNNSPLCAGSSLNLTATPIAGASYLWSGPQTFQSVAQNPSISPVETVHAGTYFLIVSVNGCTSAPVSTVVVVHERPDVPEVSNNGPLCAGSNLQLSTPLVLGGSYSWTGPNGFSSFSQNPVISNIGLSGNGAYSLILTVNGCSSEAGITPVVVHGIPSAPSASNNSPVCVGGTLNLQASDVAFGVYSWSGPNSFSSSLQNPIINNVGTIAGGVYSVMVTVNGCSSGIGTTSVSITDPPVTLPVLSNNGPLCVGATLQLSSSVVPGGMYMWTGPNGFNSLTQNPVIPNVGTFNGGNYSLTVSVGPCVLAQQSTLVVVNEVPSTPGAGNNGPLCVGQTLQLTATVIAGASYMWSGPNGFMSTLSNPTRVIGSVSDLGTYSVTVSIPGIGCTSAVGTTTVVGGGGVSTPVVSNNSPICAGSSLQLTGPSVAGGIYMWTGPNGFSSSAQNPVISNAGTVSSGVYSLVIQVGACSSAVGVSTVVVHGIPATPVVSNNGPVCAGSPLSLFGPGVVGASYTWTGPLGFNSNVQNPVLSSPVVGNTGVYSLRVTVNGCTSGIGVTTVNIKASPSAPSAGNNSPLCDGQTLQLTASTISGASYQWSGPGGFMSTVKNPSLPNVNGSQSGLYSVTVTVNGCTSSVTTTSVVINGANFVPSMGSNAPICVGSTLQLSTAMIPGATYSWTGPNNFSSNLQNPSIPGASTLQSGAYSLVVTTAGCTSQVGVLSVVVSPVPFAPNAGSSSPVCVGSTLSLSASPIAGAMYMWSGPGGFSSTEQNPTLIANSSSAGVYSVVATVNGCSSSVATTTVVVNSVPAMPMPSSNSPLCSGMAVNTTLALSTGFVSGGSYMWTGPNGFSSNLQNPVVVGATSLHAGVYSVVVSVNGCSSPVGTTNVVIGTIPMLSSAGNSGPVCAGETLSLTAESISGASYSWTGPNGFVSNVQNPVISGTAANGSGLYSVVASIGGCTSSVVTTNVIIKPVPGVPVAGNNGAICAGETLVLSASDAPGGMYMWTGPNGFVSSAQNPVLVGASVLASGVYSVQVSINGCTSGIGVTTVLVNALPTLPIASSNSPVCAGDNLQFNVVPQAGASYVWSGPNGFSSTAMSPIIPNVSSVAAGVYSIIATVNGCTGAMGSTTVVIKSVPMPPTVGNNGPICAGSTLQLSAGNVPGAVYMWTGPNGFNSNSPNPTVSNAGVGASGTYAVSVMVDGCTSMPAATVAVVNATPVAPVANSNSPVCAGGQLQLSASPALGAVYYWSGPNGFVSSLQNPVLSNVSMSDAGVYSVYMEVNGCASGSSSVSVSVGNSIATPLATSNSPVCAGGFIQLNVNPISGASYMWSGPNGFVSNLPNPILTGVSTLQGGIYSVVAMVGGCTSSTGTVNVVVNSVPTGISISNNSPLCSGNTLVLNATNISGASYSWSGPGGFSGSGSSVSISNATVSKSGVYSLVVSIGSCSSGVFTTTVVVNAQPNAPAASSNSPVCVGGSIQLTASPISGASYLWLGPGGFTSTAQNPLISSASGSNAGVYTVRATVNGCTSALGSTTVVVRTAPPAVSVSSNSPVCIGNTLSLTASLVSGASYTWSGPNNFSSSLQNPVISNVSTLAGGVYSVFITVNGCSSAVSTTTVVVTNGAGVLSAGNNGPVCVGGSLQLTASTLAGATYNWVGPNGFSSSVQNPFIPMVSSGGSGVYSVSATVGSCSASAVTTVVVNSLPVISASANSPVCAGQILNLSASPLAGASYAWSGPNGFVGNGQTVSITGASTLASGVYSVLATLNGCTGAAATVSVLVKPVPALPVVSNNGPLCVGQTAMLMVESVSGASYSWSGPNSFSSSLQNPILNNVSLSQSGVYSLVVTVNGCSSGAAGTALIINGGPSVTASNNSPICVGGTVSLSATTIAGAVYSWTGPNGFSSTLQNPVISNASTLASGSYAVTASVNGCTSTVATTTVLVKAVPATPVISGNSPVCAGQSLNLQTPTVVGGSYQWTGPNAFSSTVQNPVLSNVSTAAGGTYQLIVTVNGCSSSAATYAAVVNPVPATPTVGSNSPVCVGQSIQLTAPIVSGATYMWSGPNGFSANTQSVTLANASMSQNGIYSLVLSVNGCSAPMVTANVVVNTVPVVASIGSNSPVCVGQTLQLIAPLITGATYSWVGPNGFSANTQNVNISNAGTQHSGAYILTVTQNGCSSVPMTVTAVVNPVPSSPTAGSNSAVCVGQTLQLTASTVTGASYVWTGPNGFSANTQNASISNVGLNAAGVYSVAAMLNGCMSAPGTTTVVVNPLATASVSGTPSVCAGESTNLNLVVSGKGPWTVFYTGPNGTNSVVVGDVNSPSPSTFNWAVSPVSTATYTLINVNDGNGCTNSANGSAVVTVLAKPSAMVLGAPTATVCAGNTVSIPVQFNGTGPWTLNYSMNGVPQPAQVFGSAVSPSPSVFTVPVVVNSNSTIIFSTVMSGNGCTGIVNSTFVANVAPAATASWNTTNLNVCAGNSVNLPLSLTGTGPWTVNYTENGISQSWTLGNSGSPSPSVFAPAVSPTVSSTYSLVSVVSGNGCISTVNGNLVVNVKSVPTATLAGGNQTICMNESAVLNMSLSGTGPWVVNYTLNGQPQPAWTINSSPATVTVTPTGNAVYALTTVSDAGGCTGIATGSHSINVNPSASVNLTGGGSICAGGNSLVTVVANGKGPWTINYTANAVTQPAWVVGNVNSASPSVFVLTVSPTETTVYAGLSVTDGNGCTGVANGMFTVAVNGTATGVFAESSSSICTGGTASVNLNLTGSGPWTVNYTANGVAQPAWVLGNTNSPSPSSFLVNVSPVGATTYTISSIESANGCIGAGGSTFAVALVPVPTASLANSNSSICAGGSSTLAVTLTGQGPWTVNYSRNGNAPQTWTLGAANSASPSTFFVTVSPTESSTYTLTAVNSGTCTGTVTGTAVVTVKPLPTAVFVNSSATVCGNGASPVFLPVTVTGTGPWTINYTAGGVVQPPVTVGNSGSPSPSTFNLTVLPTANTVYVLTNVSSGNGCSQVVNSTTVVTVRPLPTAVWSTTNQTICQGTSIDLPMTLTGTGPWTVVVSVGGSPQTFVLGAANSPSPSTFIVPITASATSLVTILNVTDGGGCTRTSGSRITLTVSPAPTATLSGGATICSGQSTNLTFVVTGKGPWTLEHTQNGVAQPAITVGIPTSPSPSTFSLAMSPTQTTTYTLTGVSSGTCVGTASGSAVVNVTNGPTLAIQNQSPAQCGQGGTVTISGGLSYTLNGVTNTTGFFNNLQPGTYTVTGTDAGGCVGSIVVTITGGAAFPNVTTIQNITASSAVVNWTAVPGAQTYTVAYRPIGASNFSFVTGLTGLTTTLTGLTGGTTYEVKVKAVCPEGVETQYSGTEIFTTLAPPACATPAGLTVTVTGTTSAILSWTPNQSGAVCYIVTYGPANASESTWTTLLIPHPAATVTVNNLTSGIAYAARIRTNCSLCSSRSGIRSDASPLVTFVTPTAKGEENRRVQNDDNHSIQLYPNPNKGVFSVLQHTTSNTVQYTVFDATGKLILSKTIEAENGANQTHFDLSNQPAGVYLLKAQDQQQTQTLKVIVR